MENLIQTIGKLSLRWVRLLELDEFVEREWLGL
jgi:hypothetical protein